MTATAARRAALFAAYAFGVSLACMLIAIPFTSVAVVSVLAGLLIAAGVMVFITWATSMIAGPAVLVKLRNQPDTLGTWKSVALPLSLTFACVCAIAVPARATAKCGTVTVAVPLAAAPFYWLGDKHTGFPAYVNYGCGD